MQNNRSSSSSARLYVLRLKPHQDLKASLLKFASDHHLGAAAIFTCVGSLEQFCLRFANQKEEVTEKGFFEIVSLTGTLSETSAHLHIALADHEGRTRGGHLLKNNLIYTTAEIVIGELDQLEFQRQFDPDTGYPELVIYDRP